MTTNIMIKNKRIDTNNKITNLQIKKDCTQKEKTELRKKKVGLYNFTQNLRFRLSHIINRIEKNEDAEQEHERQR